MIVRLWAEPNHPTTTRARIIQTLDAGQDEQTVDAAASADDICDVMKRWVADFEDPAARTESESPELRPSKGP